MAAVINNSVQNTPSNRDWTGVILGVIVIVILVGAVGVGVYLVQQEQDIRNKAQERGGSACSQAEDCELLDNPGNIGNYSSAKNVDRMVIKAGTEYHSYSSGPGDNCYAVNVEGRNISWEKKGDGPNCKDVSHVQVWFKDEEPKPLSCNSTCSSDSECIADLGSGYICYSGSNTCRLAGYPDQSNCQPPTVRQCNSSCTTDSQCSSALGSDYFCYSSSNTCRLVNYPESTNCQQPVSLNCPLEPKTGDIFVDFARQRIRADASAEAAKAGPKTVNIPSGNYKVTLASSDQHDISPDTDQTREQYYMQFINSTNSIIATTNSTQDIKDNELYAITVVNDNLQIGEDVSSVLARHSAYSSNNPESFNVECAIFTRIFTPISAQCLDVKVFDNQWTRLTTSDFASLKPGDIIRLTVGATTSEGTIDKARFVINGQILDEVSQKRPGTNEFYYEYEIPEDLDQLSIRGELHHTSLGWF